MSEVEIWPESKVSGLKFSRKLVDRALEPNTNVLLRGIATGDNVATTSTDGGGLHYTYYYWWCWQ